MTRIRLRLALLTGLSACFAVSAASSPDLDRVAAALDTLQTSVNARDFRLLEPQLDESFSYQGRDAGLSRMIMRQVVSGYPDEISSVAILSVTPEGDNWSVSVRIERSEAAEERVIRLSADYQLLQADIADIQLAGHAEGTPERTSDAAPLPKSMQVPFEIRKGQIVVQATINGVSGNFLVDTGAQAITINTAHFTEAQLRTVALDHGMPSGVGGALRNVRAVPDLQLSWNGVRFEGLRGIALDLSHFENSMGIEVVGFIGFDFLERFEIYFDYNARLLTLYRLDENNAPMDSDSRGAPAATIAFDMVGHIPVFPATLGGQQMRLGLDSGAADEMLAEKWQDAMSGKSEFVRVAEMRGADKAVRASTEVRFDTLTVSSIEYEDIVFRFSDILLASGGRMDMDGLLGYQFLSARPTSINFRARELTIW